MLCLLPGQGETHTGAFGNLFFGFVLGCPSAWTGVACHKNSVESHAAGRPAEDQGQAKGKLGKMDLDGRDPPAKHKARA